MFKKIKSLFCILLSIAIMSGMLTGCSASGNATPSATKTQVTDTFKEAIQQGIAWEELAAKADKPVNKEILTTLMENSLTYLGKEDKNEYITAFSSEYKRKPVTRIDMAALLYGVNREVIGEHNFIPNSTAIIYEVGGGYNNLWVDGLPDYDQLCGIHNAFWIDGIVDCDNESDDTFVDYVISTCDRLTGDKLMGLYDDFTFRPQETVTVAEAVESALHFARSFEEDPVYTDVADERASVHTIDTALYTGKTTLPDATSQNLPDWRGFNISFNSMFTGSLCYNPDETAMLGILDHIKELGANYVHLYLTWSWFQGPDYTFDNKVNLSRLEELDRIIALCMERDLHIQLVFNDVPNLDFNHSGELEEWTANCNSVFTDETVRDNVTLFWRMMAKRYADIPNNYLSFNLMNECDPESDENYVWGLGDAVRAIQQESPGRVVVADVHADADLTGAGMAKLGCALSVHFYNLGDLSIVTAAREEIDPGFYDSLTCAPCYVNAQIYGPDFWGNDWLPQNARGALKFSGNVGGATLSVTFEEITSFDTIMQIKSAGEILYRGMEPYEYEEAIDTIHVDSTVTVTIPEDADSFEISCPEGMCFTFRDISVTLADGTELPLFCLKDWWNGTKLTEITVHDDGSCSGTLKLEEMKRGKMSLLDYIQVGKQYGVDVMVGECGLFEQSDKLSVGIRQNVVEELMLEQIDTFDRLGIAWCCEYFGRYSVATPAPYLEGVEYRKIDNSAYYSNLEMEPFFKEVMNR